MAPPGIERSLEELHDAAEPRVVRFDRGVDLAGAVAVLPSAFNPPTLAHLHLLQIASEVTPGTTAAALLTTRNVAKGVFRRWSR